MARIVVDARELRTGTGRYIERLLHYLQELESTHEFIVLIKPADFDGWQPSNPRFSKVVCPYKEFSFGEQIGLKRQLDNLKVDLVHFGMTHQPVRYRGLVVTTIHDLTTARWSNPTKNALIFKFKQQIYRWVIKRVADKSVQIITPSQYVKDDVAQYTGIDPAKITVTYEAADKITEKPQPLAELEAKRFVLYVGRAQPHKNLEHLVEAYRLIKPSQPDLLLVLTGKIDDNYRLLQKYIERQGVHGVILTDFVANASLRWLYENARAYIFPSLSEGFGLPGLEAMLYDLPVLASQATCLPEIYKDGALFFDPLNSRDLVNKLNRLLNDPQLAKNLTWKAQQVVKQYSWQTMAKQTLYIYDKALKPS